MKNEGLRRLEELANQRKHNQGPNVTKYSDASISDLQTCLVDYIGLVGGWATRINTTDIIGLLPNGKFVGIVCKQAGENCGPEQEDFAKNIIKANGLCFDAYVGHFNEVYGLIKFEVNTYSKRTTIN